MNKPKRKLVPRRRNTCPSPQDINRALRGPPSAPSASAASLDDLILRCLGYFDAEGKLCSPRGSQMVHMTLMMHSWVVPSQTFAQKLLALYKDCPPDKRGLRRGQVCHLVRTWIGQFPAAFEADPLLERTMGDLWASVRSDAMEEAHVSDATCPSPYVDLSQAPSPCVKKRKVSLIFDHMEADEMAEHLSYLEFKNFCNVSFLDYRSYVVRGSVRDNPALERSVMMCNGVSQWVQLMILNRHTAQQRAQVFTKYIQVAQRLRALQNFNTLMAVTGGLCHSAISRLKDTYNLLPPDITKALSEMTELLSSRSNYGNYRRVYGECSGFKVPILGVHLKDLIVLNEALPDFVDGDKINLSKLQHLHSNINELLELHALSPPFEANKDLLHLLTLSLDLYYTEDQIYELSYTKEPKNPKIQPVTPVKAPVVADWGSGVAPRLDPDTISKHVKQMVDSIMKNYDHKQDGFVPLEDFEKIAANFPFSFCTRQNDRAGQISREEMTSYFVRGMSVCAKLGYNFNEAHNFHETSYKKNTFCDICGGHLRGVVKQGYQCKGCGMNCHRHCRDLVGIECMKKHKNSGGSCPCTPAADSRTKGAVPSKYSDEEAFFFPHGNDSEAHKGAPFRKTVDTSGVWVHYTQTDPGVWTPQEKKERKTYYHNVPGKANTLPPPRSRGCSAPVSFLPGKLEQLHLSKEKNREPD
ncbi:RAS guanyl-releasing protein 4 [Stigmatopora argus]